MNEGQGMMRRALPLPVVTPASVARAAAKVVVRFGEVVLSSGHRVVLYGSGGVGKTWLAMQLPGPVAVVDLDESLPRLHGQLAAAGLLGNIRVVAGVSNWASLRAVLQADGWDGIRTIVIDTATRAEELAVEHTLEHVMPDGKRVSSIEGYGFGKGLGYVFDTFLPLLGDLDRHCRAGRHVVLICHDCTSNVPNPAGEDWIRFEPRLQSPASGKASIRLRVREWADHLLYVGFDVAVSKDGKGRGAGSRTMYTGELPHCMAKSRTTQEVIAVGANGAAVWAQVIK